MEILSWLVPMIISTIVVVVLFALNKFSLTQTATIKGTVRLETVNEDVEELKTQMRDGFKTVAIQIDSRSKEIQEEFRRMTTRLESLEKEGFNLRYRIDQNEKSIEYIREKKITELERQVSDIRTHKQRLSDIENELDDLRRQRAARNGGEKSPV